MSLFFIKKGYIAKTRFIQNRDIDYVSKIKQATQGVRKAVNMDIIKVFVTNERMYLEGTLEGEWLSLPESKENIEATLKRIGIGKTDEYGIPYNVYFYTDFEAFFHWDDFSRHTYDNIYELNELAEKIANVVSTEDELKILGAIIDMNGFDPIESSLDIFRDGEYCVYYDCADMTDVAEQYVANTDLLRNVPETVADFFDYKEYGHYLEVKGWFSQIDTSTYLEINQ